MLSTTGAAQEPLGGVQGPAAVAALKKATKAGAPSGSARGASSAAQQHAQAEPGAAAATRAR